MWLEGKKVTLETLWGPQPPAALDEQGHGEQHIQHHGLGEQTINVQGIGY